MGFNITELKKHLGSGLGLRKNKYLLEIPVPTVNGETINILCQSAGLPERNNTVTDIWHKGRRYTVRGETDFIGEYEISIVDDSDMRIRKVFDTWMKQIDNTRPDANSSILGDSYDKDVIDALGSAVTTATQISEALQNQTRLLDFTIGFLDSNKGLSSAFYQTDINIWQLDNTGQKVYGYKLQNAFPKQIGIVTLDDGDENTLSEFSVNFAFSEFVPIENTQRTIISSVIGDGVTDIATGISNLVD